MSEKTDGYAEILNGTITARCVDKIGEFVEIYDHALGFSRRFRADMAYNIQQAHLHAVARKATEGESEE